MDARLSKWKKQLEFYCFVGTTDLYKSLHGCKFSNKTLYHS